MTITDSIDTVPPTPDSPPPGGGSQPRLLRRSRTDRFAAGVCGGLGEYFGIDPILFRVLVAVAAFFGGSGVLAYLLAWAVVPEAGTSQAPVDGWVHKLREHRVPVWVVAVAVGLTLWLTAFSWWAPGPFVPVVAVAVLIVVLLGRRDLKGTSTPSTDAPTVDLRKTSSADARPNWTEDVRAWVSEAKDASRARRRRSLPVRIAVLGGLFVTLAVLAAIDALSAVPMVAYFWATLGFVVVGLLVGLALRRTPWGIAVLLVPALAGVVALGGSPASFHDGVGEQTWTPTRLASTYRFGIGQATLDLRELNTSASGTTRVNVGVGTVTVVVPSHANVEVQSNVHIGVSSQNLGGFSRTESSNGINSRLITRPPAGAVGSPVVVDVHLADGQVRVVRG